MTRRLQLSVLALLPLALTLPALPASAGNAQGRPDPATLARRHLSADATGRTVIAEGPSGSVRFVGTRGRATLDNPGVDAGTSVSAAARAHLDRYGAALGAAPGSSFVQRSTGHGASGVDIVRYDQQVDGVPVLGGEVVLGLDTSRDLRSLAADVTSAADVTAPTVSAATAAGTARGLVQRSHPHARLTVEDQGRFVLDPAVAGLTLPGGTRTVRRLEVRGDALRQLVLVDDHTGATVFATDLLEEINRVVCDDGGSRTPATPCALDGTLPAPPGRTETSGPSSNPEVNQAFDHAGEVSDLYAAAGQIDLTALIGLNTVSGRYLASTVDYCSTDQDPATHAYLDPCPYPNAFWDGRAMFYGAGYAAADDVVGHEMTHGFIDHTSGLFYWGQSGAINESMADVVGEIVDHRNGADDDSAWNLGEDLAGGPLRNMADPTTHGQPDRMTSASYDADPTYSDAGGVHTNSGIGNKTAYLISQGGQFNGQTVQGIDAGDPALTKTATLYLATIAALPSGAEYQDLARVLDQTCADLAVSGRAGFTTSDCVSVHQAGVATELATPPAVAAPAADADTSCPVKTVKRVLYDGESQTGPDGLYTDSGVAWWSRPPATTGESNATSGSASWFITDPATVATQHLTKAAAVTLPPGQQSFLSFQNWYLFDYDSTGYYDGGTVELAVDGGAQQSAAAGSWVNGPTRVLATGYGNTAAGQPAFSGDSHGWSVSRLDLTPYAGHGVRPQFTMHSDDSYGALGWYLDDISIYTCDNQYLPARNLTFTGSVDAVTLHWAAPSRYLDLASGFRASLSSGGSWAVGSAARSLRLTRLPASTTVFKLALSTVGTQLEKSSSPAVILLMRGVPTITGKRVGARITFRGRLTVDGSPMWWGAVRLERKSGTGWVGVKTVRTGESGKWTAVVKRRKKATYRATFLGAQEFIGTTSYRTIRR